MNYYIRSSFQLMTIFTFTRLYSDGIPTNLGKLSNFLMSACLNSCKNGICRRVNEHSFLSEVKCNCLPGYGGFHCNELKCPSECAHGKCVEESGRKFCKCNVGFFGPTCRQMNWNSVLGFFDIQRPSPVSASNETSSVTPQAQESACADNFVCQNGGHCSRTENGVKCTCVPPHVGIFCQEKCSKSCLNNGLCYLDTGIPRCNCAWGYNGEFCERAVI